MSITKSSLHWFGMAAMVTAMSLVAPGQADAQERPRSPGQVQPATHAPTSGKVTLEVQVIHATNSGKVDPALKSVEDNLKFTRFSGFELLQTLPAKLATDQDETFAIAGNLRLKVKLIGQDSRAAKLRVQMFNESGKVMDTTVSINRNRAFMLGGPDYLDGKLVLPITVRY